MEDISKETLTSEKMRNMKIIPLILDMSLPAMISMFVLALYNIVDSIFVARYSPKALDALSIAFPMQQLLIAFAVGIGVGTNAYVSRKLGQKKYEEATLTAQTGLFMALCGGAFFVIVGLTLSKPFVSTFTSDSETIVFGTQYLSIVLSLSVFSFVEIAFNRTLQATGNMKIPMLAQIVGAIVNIIFDPIFIFLCNWGVIGAATATILGQACAMLVGLLGFKLKKQDVKIFFDKNFRLKAPIVKGIIKIGVPVIVMNAVAAFVTTIMNFILKAYESAITVLGVYFKLQSFVFMPIMGLNQGVLPILSYNYGSKNKKRFMATYKWSFIFAFAVMVIGTAIFHIFPAQLMSLFSASGALMDLGIYALRAISICFVFVAFGVMTTTMLQGVRLGTLSMIMSLLRQVVLIIPLALLFAKLWGVKGVWYAYPASEITVAILFLILLKPIFNKKFPNYSEVNNVKL